MTEDLVQMAKDAARYRWLRETWGCTIVDTVWGFDAGLLDDMVDADADNKEQE